MASVEPRRHGGSSESVRVAGPLKSVTPISVSISRKVAQPGGGRKTAPPRKIQDPDRLGLPRRPPTTNGSMDVRGLHLLSGLPATPINIAAGDISEGACRSAQRDRGGRLKCAP